MNKLLVTVAAAGLLLSLPAAAQNMNTNQKSDTPAASGTQRTNPNEGRLQNDRSPSGQERTGAAQRQGQRAQSNGERSTARSDRDEHRESSGLAVRGRSTTGMSIHESHEARRGREIHLGFARAHCRDVTVKSRHHGHLVIRHIRRCS
jgi:hypothetical protein